MNRGYLADHFVGVGVKTLSGTEVDPMVSRGHELQGVDNFRAFLGAPSEKVSIPVEYVWLEDEAEPLSVRSTGTWYDSRRQKQHREAEYRLYYPVGAEGVVHKATDGDTLFLALRRDRRLVAFFCRAGSSIESQLLWLFGLSPRFSDAIEPKDLTPVRRDLDLAARYVLDLIGVGVEIADEDWLTALLREFGDAFPTTQLFSAFARKMAGYSDPCAKPDETLLEWVDTEERLFMTLERHIVGKRLEGGFITSGQPDVQAFIDYSLHVQNRRKARAGQALGNQLEAILSANDIPFKREATTEKKGGADFLFPSQAAYHDSSWPSEKLAMLAAKRTCKDRWRQVLAEADRIDRKHLITLEPGISEAQTNEMQKQQLQLVVPAGLHETYRDSQRSYLFSLDQFLCFLKSDIFR